MIPVLDRGTLLSILKARVRHDDITAGIRQDCSAGSRIPAAVLIIIHFTYGSARVLLCRRSERLANHAGQIAFPGGVFRSEDGDLLNTAIREAGEEIGVHVSRDCIVGSLDEVNTFSSNFRIKPFVAVVDSIREMRMNEDEIAQIIDAPIAELLGSMSRDEEHAYKEAYRFTYRGHVIWGATARILKQLRDILDDVLEDHQPAGNNERQ